MRMIFLFCIGLVLFPFSCYAQNSWIELGKDTTSSNGGGYSNFCRDAVGNMYSGIGRTIHKWNNTTHVWDQVGGDILSTEFRLFCISTDASGNVYAAGAKSGNIQAVAKWDGTIWKELKNDAAPLNLNGSINGIATDRSGNVYIAGAFQTNNHVYVAKWDGISWSEVRSTNSYLNFSQPINCITTDPSGYIYVAGQFRNNYSPNYCYVAKWDGSIWSELGGPSALRANDYIYSIASDSSGNIYAAGLFNNASGKKYVAKWDGVSWNELGTGSNALNANNTISSIDVDTAGNVYAAGNFTNANNKYYVAKWNGVFWNEIGEGPNALNPNYRLTNIRADLSGNVYAAGHFTNEYGKSYIARWDNVSWTSTGMDTIAAKSLYAINCVISDRNGYLYAGMSRGSLLGGGYNYVAKWNGTSWSEIGSGNNALNVNNSILCIAIDTISGNIYAAGRFTNNSNYRYVAKWDGSSWIELGGTNALQANSGIQSMITDTAGNIYAALSDYRSGGYNNQVAKWDGVSWSVVGNFAYSGYPTSIALNDSGKIFVAAGSRVRIWDGISWTTSGNFINPDNGNATVNTVATDNAGNVYAGGLFINNNKKRYVAKYNGIEWSELDTVNALNANNEIYSLTTDAAGNVYAAGAFTNEKGYYYISRYGVDLKTLNSYIFTGNGNWDIPANWMHYTVPPVLLAKGKEIIIDPATPLSNCIFNGIQFIPKESKLTIAPGKRFLVLKDLRDL